MLTAQTAISKMADQTSFSPATTTVHKRFDETEPPTFQDQVKLAGGRKGGGRLTRAGLRWDGALMTPLTGGGGRRIE